MVMTLLTRPKISVATVVIATDGSGDFNCNGTADDVEIQAAIDSLPATGGCIYIKEGVYDITNTILIDKDNVSIMGCGHSTIFRVSVVINYLINVTANTDYFTFELIQLDGNDNCVWAVLRFSGATTRSRVSNCWLDNWEPRGITFVGAGEGIIIENCVFEAADAAGPNYAILINASSRSFIRGNYIYGGTNVYGIQIYKGTSWYISIIDNKIINVVSSVTISGTSGSCGRCIVSSNIFPSSSGWAIWIQESDHNIITDNEFFGGTKGIFLEDDSNYNTVANNRISGCTTGIEAEAAADDENIIESNMIHNCTNPIVDGGTNTQIFNNKEL